MNINQKAEDGSDLSAMTNKHMVYFHALNSDQADDILVFGKENEVRRYVDVSLFSPRSGFPYVSPNTSPKAEVQKILQFSVGIIFSFE